MVDSANSPIRLYTTLKNGPVAGPTRVTRVGQALTGAERDSAGAAFNAGYRAGINDVFGGYDGGWSTGAPYVVTLVAGTGGATYRISSRIEMRSGVNYFLCPDRRSLCQSAR